MTPRPRTPQRTSASLRQWGLSLVELMVAMVIGLMLMAGVVQLFIGVKQSYRYQEQLGRMQENGRFAIKFLTQDIRMADFWGCLGGSGEVHNDLNAGGSGFVDFQAGGLEGDDDSELAGSDSDRITLRGAFGSGINVRPPFMPTPSSSLHLHNATGLDKGDLVAVSDCKSTDVFQITNANPSGSNEAIHNPGGSVDPGNATGDLSKTYGAGSQLFNVREVTYSIDEDADGIPTLFRQIDTDARQPMVRGVEQMQILYGEDSDGDQTADYYVRADEVIDMDEVVSLRISLLVRSLEDNIASNPQSYTYMGNQVTPDDRRMRQVYRTTVSIRNRLE